MTILNPCSGTEFLNTFPETWCGRRNVVRLKILGVLMLED